MKLRRIVLVLAVVCSIFGLVGVGPAAAAANTKGEGRPVEQKATGNGSVSGYDSDSALQNGTIVQLDSKDAGKAIPATSDKSQQMYGVTVDPHLLSLTVSNASLAHEVFVATSGTYDVLVSNQAGAIKHGDYITISSINGVGMNAGDGGATVFGRAAGDFSGKNNVVGSTTLQDKSGQSTQKVNLGLIPVSINIQRNPNEKSTTANLPKSLQRVGEAIADKPVSPVRIYLSIAIAGLSIIVALVIMYSGIRSSLIAIGRNPLSKKTIYRGLLEIIITSILIVIIGLFAVYLLLKL